MSRIKSEDPADAKALTPEQEGLVEGAGLRPFHPPLEGLEDRQFMDADFGHALLALMLPAADGGDPRDGHVRALGGQQQGVGAQIAGQAAAQQLQAFLGEERIGAIRCNDCIAQQDGSLLLSVDATAGADQHRLHLVLTARQDGGGTYYECTRVFQGPNPNVRLSDDLQSRMQQQLAHVTGPQTTSAIDAVFAVEFSALLWLRHRLGRFGPGAGFGAAGNSANLLPGFAGARTGRVGGASRPPRTDDNPRDEGHKCLRVLSPGAVGGR